VPFAERQSPAASAAPSLEEPSPEEASFGEESPAASLGAASLAAESVTAASCGAPSAASEVLPSCAPLSEVLDAEASAEGGCTTLSSPLHPAMLANDANASG